jgi:hypothetical protein
MQVSSLSKSSILNGCSGNKACFRRFFFQNDLGKAGFGRFEVENGLGQLDWHQFFSEMTSERFLRIV